MPRWSDQLSKAFQIRRGEKPEKDKTPKYGNKTAVVMGQGFRSGLEGEVYQMLILRERAGEIRDVQREQSIELTPSIKHKMDFTAVRISTGELFGIEAKGVTCATWSLKRRLYIDLGPFEVEVWKREEKTGRLFVAEVIKPGKHAIVKRGSPHAEES